MVDHHMQFKSLLFHISLFFLISSVKQLSLAQHTYFFMPHLLYITLGSSLATPQTRLSVEYGTARLDLYCVLMITPSALSYDHHYSYFGTLYWPSVLDPPGFELPLPGLPSGFSTALLARL